MVITWIRAHYDRFAALVAALFLLLCALFIWRQTIRFSENVSVARFAQRAVKVGPLGQTAELEEAIRQLRQPAQWTFAGRSGLFVPERHFIGPDGVPATLQTTQVHPPASNEWLEQFALPIADADVLTQDPDGDGFTNLDEWRGHSNPIDRNSHPGYLTKLEMKSFTRQLFRMVFASWVGDTYAINTIDLKEPTQFLQIGDAIRGTQFRIIRFTEKHEQNQYGTDVDVSELLLQQEDTHEQLTLVKEKTAISPESVANFIYLWAGRRDFQLRKDQEFSLPPQEKIKYRLVDVQPDRAVIANCQTPTEQIEIVRSGP
jgi:hypothetical protein